MSEVLDVVIVGGGLVGGLTALLLAQGGVQPTVLDAAPVLDVLCFPAATCVSNDLECHVPDSFAPQPPVLLSFNPPERRTT